jgi:hypothetical protein
MSNVQLINVECRREDDYGLRRESHKVTKENEGKMIMGFLLR